MIITVETQYPLNDDFDLHLDEVAEKAVGRGCTHAGAGFGNRDLGWDCESEPEAERIKIALQAAGFFPVEILK